MVNHKKQLQQRMSALGVRKQDVIERFIRSAGPGGQNINKTSTRVHLKHIPTGITVKFDRQRSQAQNRVLAWNLLLDKIEALRQRRIAEERQRIEKLRRSRRRRSAKAQVRILEEKRIHAKKKRSRAKIKYLTEE